MPAPPATRRRSAALQRAAAGFALASWVALPVLAELRVGAASSLREPLLAIARLYQQATGSEPVTVAFGASSVLASQLRAGAPLDLILAADERIVRRLAQDGLTGDPVDFASNRLVVVAARELAVVIQTPGDLARPEIRRIAIPEHAVPVGRYARSWLRSHDLETPLASRLVRTEHARATLAVVDQGHADVAIVYASDARLARSARIVLEIPASEQPRIAYAAALVRGSREPEAARAFLDFLRQPPAADLLARAGFGPPPAEAPEALP